MTDLFTHKQDSALRENIRKLFDMLGESRPCKKCGRKIWFVKSKNGKAMPVTDEALSHFADCPGANGFRKGGE